MSTIRNALYLLLALGTFLLGGCAILQHSEPIDVTMVGVDPLEGQGLELRMLVKLRVQNPNDSPLEFNGVSVQLDVQGKRFATGVSNAVGSVSRFGETIVSIPVSISMSSIARQAIGVLSNEYSGRLDYELSGRLAGPMLGSVRYNSKGTFTLPAELSQSGK